MMYSRVAMAAVLDEQTWGLAESVVVEQRSHVPHGIDDR